MAKKGLSMRMTGDWKKAGVYMQRLEVRLHPAFEAQLWEDGRLTLETIQGHIDNQDLPWTPLAERTIELKKGDTTIYVETGELRGCLEIRRIKSSVKGSTIFVGASPWKTHKESGLKFSDLMIYLEYGTDRIPPRPLIEPSREEVKDIIEKNWEALFEKIVKGR